ncbi:hypothetical protein Ahy_A10g048339 [Arachis hypogaea]|uniref:Uncharacterized protein n=1 Tax=Arachis hypogaea TaxID=3818 RepID=A0A445B4W4_ARAHY|nr:hypothetical protein Ahy_A10g048339 [Arachis hypogaea]
MRAIFLEFLTPSLLSVLSLHLERTALSNCPSALVLRLIKMNMMMLQTLMMILIFNRVMAPWVMGKGVKGHRGSCTTAAAAISTTSTFSGTLVVPDFQSGPLSQQPYLMVPNPSYTGLPPPSLPTPGCMGPPPPPPPPISIPPPLRNSSLLVDSETPGSSSTSLPLETASVPNSVTKKRLVPDEKTSWLPFSPASQKITEIIKKRYDKPYKKFGDVPLSTKKLWFKEWKSHFLIDDDDDEFFWRTFKYKTSKRFSQVMSDIREGVDTTHKWLIPTYKKVLEMYWKTDEKWKNIRKKARENRASLLGSSVHCGGSIPLSSTIERIKKQLGRTPTHEEVFKETHTLKNDKSKWVDKRSQDTHEEVFGGQNKNRVYEKGSFFSSSIKSGTTSANSVSRRAPRNQNSVPDLREQIHNLNEELFHYYEKVRASSSSSAVLLPPPPPPPPPLMSSNEDCDDEEDEDDTKNYS